MKTYNIIPEYNTEGRFSVVFPKELELSKVEFGKLNHGSQKPKEIKVWLKPNKCILRY